MLKKTIAYIDYNGDEQIEDFYFNINKSEATKLEVSDPAGFSSYMQRIVEENNKLRIFEVFESLLMLAYGEKSEDGRHFRKSDDMSRDFVQSAAYDALFEELTSNQKALSDFVIGVFPTTPETEAQVLEVMKTGGVPSGLKVS